MNNSVLKMCCFAAAVIFITSCKKGNTDNPAPTPTPPGTTTTLIPGYTDTAGVLKVLTASKFSSMGFAVTYGIMANNAAYRNTVKTHGNVVTFGNELKEGSIVKSDGTYDYSTADALYNICNANGLQVFGHTLVWHSQQNTAYLNGLIAAAGTPGVGGTPGPNILAASNGDFQQGTGNTFSNWQTLVGGTAAATYAEVAGNGSTRALQVTVTTPGANGYDVQAIGPVVSVPSAPPARTINFSIDIKAAAAGGKVRVVVQNTNYLAYDITPTTSWATYTFSLQVAEAAATVRLNFPNAGTYAIDNITASDPTQGTPGVGGAPATAAQAAAVIDNEMKRYITTSINHFAGKINAWDVVNEVFADGNAAMRTDANSSPGGSQFFYGKYLGVKYDQDNYVLKAFKYAKQANASVLRFINDYNLEYNRTKTDSLVALVNFINKDGAALIDGIGTQMHISINSNKSNIDYSFQKLASTGLKIKISEMDVAANTAKSSSFTADAATLAAQADMYKYVIKSYITNVPAAQRYGLTVWGVADTDSWINSASNPDIPLLFDKNYVKKAAFVGVKLGVQ
jgi:endo-1,4-beta-xylanase